MHIIKADIYCSYITESVICSSKVVTYSGSLFLNGTVELSLHLRSCVSISTSSSETSKGACISPGDFLMFTTRLHMQHTVITSTTNSKVSSNTPSTAPVIRARNSNKISCCTSLLDSLLYTPIITNRLLFSCSHRSPVVLGGQVHTNLPTPSY